MVTRNKAKQSLVHALLHLQVETIGSGHQTEHGGIRIGKLDDRLPGTRKVDTVDCAFACQMSQVDAAVGNGNRRATGRPWRSIAGISTEQAAPRNLRLAKTFKRRDIQAELLCPARGIPAKCDAGEIEQADTSALDTIAAGIEAL